MAILTGLIRKMSGSVGDFTFSQNQGRTIVSEKTTNYTDRRTDGQVRIRTRLGNIVQMYRGIRPLLDCAFEGKTAGVSDFNMFVKVNMRRSPVYLTSTEVGDRACVVAPYQISRGQLPAIGVTSSDTQDVTDIALGSLVIDATTTVAQFSNAVVQNNEAFDYGDQIAFFRIGQILDAGTGTPRATFKAWRVTLDKTSDSLLLAVVPSDGFQTVSGYLGRAVSAGNYAIAWVHSRKENGSTYVSSQVLVSHNRMLASYVSDDAYALAAASYGGKKAAFLTPGSLTTTMAMADGDGSEEAMADGDGDGSEDEDSGTGSGTSETGSGTSESGSDDEEDDGL